MAVIAIPEPMDIDPDNTAWQENLSKVSKISRGLGLMICRLTNMANESEPQVAEGTRFELNSVLFECNDDEPITGWASIPVSTICYVYAVPGVTVPSFEYSTVEPTFDVAKGGWYNGANRALFRLYKTATSTYAYKQVTDGIDTIPIRTSDPSQPEVGQIWLRVDLV